VKTGVNSMNFISQFKTHVIMNSQEHLKKRNKQVKLIRIDESTWIEASVDVPDQIARQKYLEKLAIRLNNPPGQLQKKVNGSPLN
jgi:ribonucleotide reductase beta subunit family protein with ferritin-like domain